MNVLNPKVHSVSAFAPATCANVAVGFDILGFAFGAVGDTVTLSLRKDKSIVIEKIISPEKLPYEIDRNTATVALQAFCKYIGLDCGFSVNLEKGIPLSSGMGGSAASAVAALFACNAFLQNPLPITELLQFALLGEEAASGHKHADNIVPCIYGGFTLIQDLHPLKVLELPTPSAYCVLLHPHIHVSTRDARDALKPQISMHDFVQQSGHLATFIASLYKKDLRLLKSSYQDIVIEHQRAGFVPGFYAVKKAALDAGALGVSFSGSGPSMLALAEDKAVAEKIAVVMEKEFGKVGLKVDTWIGQMSEDGAKVVGVR